MNKERGSVGVLVAGLAAFAVAMCLLVVDVAHVYAARAGVVTAADAAALAAAPVTFAPFGTPRGPTHAAAATAVSNGAELLQCRCEIDRSWAARRVTVTVGVSVGLTLLGDRHLTATSSAEFRPIALGPPAR